MPRIRRNRGETRPHWGADPKDVRAIATPNGTVCRSSDLSPSPDFKALFYELLARDSWEMAIHPLDAPDDWSRIAVACPRHWGMQSADDIASLGTHPLAAFGPEGDWGLVSFATGGTVLAGAPALMDKVIARAGGIDAIRSRFAAWTDDTQG